jgi:hypothetical protein
MEVPMSPNQNLEARRNAILEEMRSIRSMRRGTINEQYLKVRLQRKKEPVLRGPYYVLSRREGEKTVSQRLTSLGELEQARKEVEEYQRFLSLCREFEQVTMKLGEVEREGAELEREKKRFRSFSRKTGR